MNIDGWIENNKEKFGSNYELQFIRNVIPRVKGIDINSIQAQYPFVDKDERQRYCDFVFIESEYVRFAIEIDGYDKRGTGTGMSRDEFIDWQRRQVSLASQGWYVLRFANTDVRDFPGRCADYISDLLGKLRKSELGKVEIVTINEDRENLKEEKYKRMRILIILIFIYLVLLSIFLVVYINKEGLNSIDEINNSLAGNKDLSNNNSEWNDRYGQKNYKGMLDGFYGQLKCSDPVVWNNANKFYGDVVQVIGPLLRIKVKKNLNESKLLIDVGNKFPEKNRFQVVVSGGSDLGEIFRAKIGDWEYEGDSSSAPMICVYGKVIMYKGVPQVEVKEINQIAMKSGSLQKK